MYFHKTPRLFEILFPFILWRIKTTEKVIYLTFDDGPIPELTPIILDILNEYNAKATFFVVGDNIQKYPELKDEMLANGHIIANHTFNHLNGWQIKLEDYLTNVDLCEKILPERNSYFRPPYGKMTWKQAKNVSRSKKIVMWDSLSGDFDSALSPEKCLTASIKSVNQGSIIVFHDNLKVKQKIEYVLPAFLAHFSALGYQFKALP
jgi:peptidoglycan/xylan/chitin deacetylase (PgdA/CDA1 family)